jgi:D-sedoheptulose 7-phosphate isomerase
MNSAQIRQIAEEHAFLLKTFFDRCADDVAGVADRLVRTVRQGRKVLLFGNGGSAADAQHIAAELVNRFQVDRPGLPAIALTTDTSALTSIANDVGFDQVFARQIDALGRKGDLAIALSTSGNSPNVVEAVRAAREREIETVGLLGRDGGRAREFVDHALVVGAEKSSRIQEIHILVGHVLCEAVEEALFRPAD